MTQVPFPFPWLCVRRADGTGAINGRRRRPCSRLPRPLLQRCNCLPSAHSFTGRVTVVDRSAAASICDSPGGHRSISADSGTVTVAVAALSHSLSRQPVLLSSVRSSRTATR